MILLMERTMDKNIFYELLDTSRVGVFILNSDFRVADNGLDFEPRRLNGVAGRPGWGLMIMAERAEAVGIHCQVESQPEQGTKVIVGVSL
jgi:nitrate/nitrite-specific signal transduction histidine kinase